jgi:hypothetical protein
MPDDHMKKLALCEIMEKVHALAEIAWPRDGCGVSKMPDEALRAIMDVQASAGAAIGLPDNVPLMTGDPMIDVYG